MNEPAGEQAAMDLLTANPALAAILQAGEVEDAAGRRYPLHSSIRLELAEALYRTVSERRPEVVIEVGMAYGIASLAILTAGAGRLISLDPSQSTDWHGVGVANVARCGFGDRHTLIEEPSFAALPALLRAGQTAGLAYIDGWHTFDYTLVDAFYLDKLLPVGGMLAFNDAGWRSVAKVCSWVQRYRRYRELDVGLKPDYRAGNPAKALLRRALGWSRADRYFEKLEDWEPDVKFYTPL
jgi:predicted O-methyltransferase YrrM